MTGSDLAARQAALVAALATGAPVPPGFDAGRVGIARAALLRKRSGETARSWPLLAAALGARWTATFTAWAQDRPTNGGLRDGWELARQLAAAGTMPQLAAAELAGREAGWHYDGRSAPRRRRWPAVGTAAGCVAVQVAGRVRVLRATTPGRLRARQAHR